MKPLLEFDDPGANDDEPAKGVTVGDIRAWYDEIERLRRDCAELYQVIGTMAEHCPDPTDPAIVKALDNASDAANGDPRRHDDLLPFVLPMREYGQSARPAGFFEGLSKEQQRAALDYEDDDLHGDPNGPRR